MEMGKRRGGGGWQKFAQGLLTAVVQIDSEGPGRKLLLLGTLLVLQGHAG